MPHKIAFQREGKTIIAEVYNHILEPFEAGGYKHQLIYFAKDSEGKKYRVPKSDVIVSGRGKKKKRKSA